MLGGCRLIQLNKSRRARNVFGTPSRRGGVPTVQHPLEGGVGQFQHPPSRNVLELQPPPFKGGVGTV